MTTCALGSHRDSDITLPGIDGFEICRVEPALRHSTEWPIQQDLLG
jgi:hypothetical protein